MSQTRILMVEDEAFLARVLANTLTDRGYQVTCIEDGQQAWELLQNNDEFDLLLLDRGLPGMDGLSLLKNIKQEPRLADIPVVMETGMDDGDSIREGLNAGAYYYLTKPVHHQLLLTVITAALQEVEQSRKMRDALEQANESFLFLDQGVFSCRTLDEARRLAQAVARAFPDPKRVVMGLTELLINAVEHGNLGISYSEKTRLVLAGQQFEEIERRLQLPEYQDRRVVIEVRRSDQSVTARISDEGEGFNWQDYLEFSPERAFDPHGRGIAMARQSSFDNLEYEGKGNIVSVSVASQSL